MEDKALKKSGSNFSLAMYENKWFKRNVERRKKTNKNI